MLSSFGLAPIALVPDLTLGSPMTKAALVAFPYVIGWVNVGNIIISSTIVLYLSTFIYDKLTLYYFIHRCLLDSQSFKLHTLLLFF